MSDAIIDSGGHYSIWSPPPLKGYWQLGPQVDGGWCTRFAQYTKPTDEQIKNTEQLLGWVWIEPEGETK